LERALKIIEQRALLPKKWTDRGTSGGILFPAASAGTNSGEK
jgi:hypothetical protein